MTPLKSCLAGLTTGPAISDMSSSTALRALVALEEREGRMRFTRDESKNDWDSERDDGAIDSLVDCEHAGVCAYD